MACTAVKRQKEIDGSKSTMDRGLFMVLLIFFIKIHICSCKILQFDVY